MVAVLGSGLADSGFWRDFFAKLGRRDLPDHDIDFVKGTRSVAHRLPPFESNSPHTHGQRLCAKPTSSPAPARSSLFSGCDFGKGACSVLYGSCGVLWDSTRGVARDRGASWRLRIPKFLPHEHPCLLHLLLSLENN